MIPAPFAYARPTTIDEALQAVASGGEDVKILAGGQSLIPVMRLRLAAPETVVAPVFNYTDEQRAMMAELREASPPSKIRSAFD